MSRAAVIVPVRVDLLAVTTTTPTAGPLADFSGLPWNDGRRDINPGRPHLAAEVADAPFEEAAARLPVGIHLHWTLPTALTRGMHRTDGDTPEYASRVASVEFPRVPNRWLVDTPGGWWIVESDYVHPEGAGGDAVTYLLTPAERERFGSRAPYRRVGRQMPLREWRHDPDARYLAGLTAAGWGHPAFHAYHPNCHSVFGFHHAAPEHAHRAAEAYPFRVFGWYSHLAHDPVAAAGRHRSDEELLAHLAAEFRWEATGGRPERLLCAGRWAPGGGPPPEGVEHVVLGARGGEALAAHVAAVNSDMDQHLPPGTDVQTLLADLTESFQLAATVDPARPDAAAAMGDARHAEEFLAVPGGSGWTIRARGPAGPADATLAPAGAHGSAPDDAVALLAELSRLQQAGDRLARTATTQRAQLHADWCAYLECTYQPRGSTLDRPDVDEIRRHIEVTSLAELEATAVEALAAAHRRAAVALQVVEALFAADVDACEVRAEDVADWAALTERGVRVRVVPPPLATRVGERPDDPTLRAEVLSHLRAVIRSVRPPDGGPLPSADADAWVEVAAAALLPDHPEVASGWIDAAATHTRGVRAALRNREVLEGMMRGQVRVAPKVHHELAPRPGPRFWQPRDPVLLLAGPGAAPDDHPDRGGPVACTVVALPRDLAHGLAAALGGGPAAGSPLAAALAVEAGSGHAGHAVLLDWSVALHEAPGLPAGDPGYLTSRFSLVDDRPDIVPHRRGAAFAPGRTSLVTGRALLGTHPLRALADALSRRRPIDPQTSDPFVEEFAGRLRRDLPGAAVQVASLSGLHDALLMLEPVVLPVGVADPLGFPEAQAFAERVAVAIGHHALRAPRPQLHFMPLRVTRLRLAGLQLLDGFGRVRPVPVDRSGPALRGTSTVPAVRAGNGTTFRQPARLVPPARLAIRWLAAGSHADEAHDHPTTGPVCGWLLPDLLDDTLAVHTADGQAIGSVDEPGRWRPAPGRDRVVPPEDIADPHLRRVALHLLHLPRYERDALLRAITSSLDRIEPDHGRDPALSLLVGRPIAVVRASVRLELLGAPPVDQSWAALRTVMAGGRRGDGGLSATMFPLRLGEHARLDDGLLGFWVERGTGFDGPFRPPRGIPGGPSTAGGQLALRVDAPPLHLTLLVDPRAAVHATAGVLPTKVLRIPAAQYATALHAIAVTFPTTPLLTDPGTLRVARPAVPGHTWSWLERTADGWRELPDGELGAPRTEAAFVGVQELREGWLRLTPTPEDTA